MVELTFTFTDGTQRVFRPVRWEYKDAHEGYHPAEYIIVTKELGPLKGDEHSRFHIPCSKVKYLQVFVVRDEDLQD